MTSLRYLLFTLCMALPLAVSADQLDARLDELFAQLKASDDVNQAVDIEARIWQIWVENDNPQFYGLMLEGINLMNRNALPAALEVYTRLISMAPDYAEAWNKRATIYYLMKNYTASEADIASTLALEPFHFGALSGLGLVHLAQKQDAQARSAFQAALEVYPTMEGVRSNLDALESFLSNGAI